MYVPDFSKAFSSLVQKFHDNRSEPTAFFPPKTTRKQYSFHGNQVNGFDHLDKNVKNRQE